MSNRASRRADHKKKSHVQRMTRDQKVAALIKNGIRPEDLKTSYDEGYAQGWRHGVDGNYQMCFAAVCLALQDLHNFSREQIRDVVVVMQKYIIDTLTSAEAIQAVYKRTGLILDLDDPLSWIHVEVEDE